MNSKEKDVISILDLILKRALRSKKATGTRLFLLKAMIDLGSGWHTTREILQKLSTYDKSLPRKIETIFLNWHLIIQNLCKQMSQMDCH